MKPGLESVVCPLERNDSCSLVCKLTVSMKEYKYLKQLCNKIGFTYFHVSRYINLPQIRDRHRGETINEGLF